MKIEKLDHQGRGICYYNDLITFVDNALPGEEVEIKITKQDKKYNEAIVTKYLKTSDSRKEAICPFFNKCGGCKLMNMSYEDTLKYKKNKVEEIIKKYANLSLDVPIIKCDNELNYRNKITLKVKNNELGFYEENTHNIANIDYCYIASNAINKLIKDIKLLGVHNGEIMIRNNNNDELLISITTKEKIFIKLSELKRKHKIAGIIVNGKIKDGDNKFIDVVNNKLFMVHYNSFFQNNINICEKLFDLINKYIEDDSIVLDLFCGVGTLGINIAPKAKKVYSIEIIANAIKDAIKNSKINKIDNMLFMLGDVNNCVSKIKGSIDSVIIDPPRKGMEKETIEYLNNVLPKTICYISCNPITLARDIKLLNYEVEEIYALDMFPYTHHVECVCIMKSR